MAVNPFLARLNAMLGRQNKGQPVPDATGSSTPDASAGAATDGGSSGSQGVSGPPQPLKIASGRSAPDTSGTDQPPAAIAPWIGPPAVGQKSASEASKDTPAEGDVAPSAQEIGTSFDDAAGSDKGPNVGSGANEPLLASQLPKNPLMRALAKVTGMAKESPAPGQVYTGPQGKAAEGTYAGPNQNSKLGTLAKFAGGIVQRGAENYGSNFDREMLLEREKIASQRALARAQLASLDAWRQGQLPIKQQTADAATQRAETGEAVGEARIPLLSAQTGLAGAKTGLAQSQDEKTQLEVEQIRQGLFPVDPITAQLVNRPELAGKAVSPFMWKQMQGVLTARGLKAMDLGQDGYWMVDRAGNKVHQISAVGPSVARAQAYGANRPVQALTSEGNLQWMPAGQAYAQGASPAGEGTKTMQKEAQFRDIQTGSARVRLAINNLDTPLSAGAISSLTMAMRETDPNVFHQLMDNFFGTQQLTPAQKDFAVAVAQINERALSLRNIAGMGSGSDSMRAAIRATLPNAKSGDKDLMLKQLNAFDQMVDALHTGVPGTAVNPRKPAASTTGGATHIWTPQGLKPATFGGR